MYGSYGNNPSEPASFSFPITPADALLPVQAGKKTGLVTRAIYVGTTGTLEVTLGNDYNATPIQSASGNKSSTWVFTSAGAITIAAHGFKNIEHVMVAGGTLPTGLSAATDYWIVLIDANTFGLASSLTNAKAGTQITLTGSSLTCTVYRTWQVASSQITISGHGFVSGDRVMVYSTTTLPTGVSAQTAYYVAVIDANTISLCTSYANATAASPTVITLSGSPAGILAVFKSSLISSAAVGYHPLCAQQVNAASTATNLVGLA